MYRNFLAIIPSIALIFYACSDSSSSAEAEYEISSSIKESSAQNGSFSSITNTSSAQKDISSSFVSSSSIQGSLATQSSSSSSIVESSSTQGGPFQNSSSSSDKIIDSSAQSSSSIFSSSSTRSSSSFEESSSSIGYAMVGFFTDKRDNNVYTFVQIGNQIWMAVNLNYKTEPGSYCYDNDDKNCNIYGRLYTWEVAISVCPDGWHLPTLEEYKLLEKNAGGDSDAGENLKAEEGWDNNGNGSDLVAFSALPSGLRKNDDKYYFIREYAYFWNSTEISEENGSSFSLTKAQQSQFVTTPKVSALSVRCVMNP